MGCITAKIKDKYNIVGYIEGNCTPAYEIIVFTGTIPDMFVYKDVALEAFDASTYFTGVGVYTLEGTVPDGIVIDKYTGQINGTPTVTGVFAGITVKESDAFTWASSNPFEMRAEIHPAFIGHINDNIYGGLEAIGPYDFSTVFTGDVYTYALIGTWPAGAVLDTVTGIISGNWADTDQTYYELQVSAIGSGSTAYTNTFSVTITAAPPAPVFDGDIVGFYLTLGEKPNYDVSDHFLTGGTPTTYTLNNAPAWMTIDTFGVISGVPDVVESVFGISVTGTNISGSDTTNEFESAVDSDFLILAFDRYQLSGNHATLARDSAATVTDWEGIVRTVLPNEFRFKGARRVENIVYTQGASGVDITDGWGAASGAVIVDSNTVSFGTSNTSRIQIAGADVNKTYAWSADIWVDSGTYDVRFASSGVSSKTLTVNTTRTRYSSADTPIANGNFDFRNGVSQPGGEVHITNILIEDVTDQSNQAPSEFIIPNDSACSVKDLPVRYFPYENGNTVDANGVVTEAKGADLTTLEHLMVEESQSNFLYDSANPATQTRSLVAGDYFCWMDGGGTTTLSGGATGVVDENTGQAFTLGSTTDVTFTIAGEVIRFQCEA